MDICAKFNSRWSSDIAWQERIGVDNQRVQQYLWPQMQYNEEQTGYYTFDPIFSVEKKKKIDERLKEDHT